MNINIIKRFAFLALALAVPSVASAELISVEEAQERHDIRIALLSVSTPGDFELVVNYPQAITLECVQDTPKRTRSADGLLAICTFIISSNEKSRVGITAGYLKGTRWMDFEYRSKANGYKTDKIPLSYDWKSCTIL